MFVGWLVTWEHHESQHHTEEEDGIEEETKGCRASGGTGDTQESNDLVEEFVGFGVGAEEKDEGAVETVFGLQKDVHLYLRRR